jgi:hypothetical protein
MLKATKRSFVLFLGMFLSFIALADHLYAGNSGPASRTSFNAANAGANDPWTQDEIMQPEELARLLAGEHKPAVVQVGIIHLYKLGHITGSKYAGPGNSAEGLDLLKKEVQALNRNSALVFYCGCCPWGDCPNIRPAYKVLREMGFKKIRVLNLSRNFSEDWAAKGFPVEKGGS